MDGTALVGYDGNGSLTITNGATLNNTGEGAVGTLTGSTGTATVDGAGSSWTMTDDLAVGYFGAGSLTISGGGLVSNVFAEIGSMENASGEVTVTGAGSRWVNADNVEVGVSGGGELTVEDGGAAVTAFSQFIGSEVGSDGRVTVDGSGSSITTVGGTTVGFRGVGSLTITDGGVLEQLGNNPLVGNTNHVGFFENSFGTVVVSDANSQWNITDELFIGGSESGVGGVAFVTIQNGGEINVGATARVFQTAQVILAGGVLNASEVDVTGSSFSGFGEVNGAFSGNFTTIGAVGGELKIGDATRTDGFATTGLSSATETGTLVLLDADEADLGAATTLNGGALVARNGARLDVGETLNGFGIVVGDITGPGNNQLAAAPLGTVDFRGTLNVGADTATVYSQGRGTINGTLSFLPGGQLVTPTNELFVGSSGIIQGVADLSGQQYTGTIGSKLIAQSGLAGGSSNALAVGDSSSTSGFYSNGEIVVEAGANLRLDDANDAVLDSGSFVRLGAGVDSLGAGPATLAAANGLTLDFGGNVAGTGTIDTPNNAATPFTNNGHIAGDSLVSPITLNGYIKGVGTLDHVVITGTDAPGFSPATVNRGSVEYAGTLEIEIGGTGAGQFDKLNHILGDGDALLGGELLVSLIDGYTPTAGDAFEFLTAIGDISNVFDSETLPEFNNGLFFDILYGTSSVQLVVAGVEGDYNFDGFVDAADYTVWRDNLGTTYTVDDYDVWRDNFGATAVIPSALASVSTSVPEPASFLTAMLGFLLSLPLCNARSSRV